MLSVSVPRIRIGGAPLMPRRRVGQKVEGGRRGRVACLRITAETEAALQRERARLGGPRSWGPWLLWRALPNGPSQQGLNFVTETQGGNSVTESHPPSRRIVLDLCGGTGAWSRPYVDAGYDVRLVTLPEHDVRRYEPPADVWGVLAAPPCTEFSMAKNGQPRDLLTGLETICACLRVIASARPRWWALENPTGLLSRWLGTPRDVFEPCDFGDPWTKRTAIWGDFVIPARGPFVVPTSGMPGRNATERAITPPGFARAFFAANP